MGNQQSQEFEERVDRHIDTSRVERAEVAKNVRTIHKWVRRQQQEAKAADEKERAEKIANVLNGALDGVEEIGRGGTIDIINGCMKIVSSAAVLLGPGYAAITSVICGLLSTMLSFAKEVEVDLPTQLHRIVHEELLNFKQSLTYERFAGLELRISNLTMDVNHMASEADIPREAESITNDLLQFVGEIGSRFSSAALSRTSTDADKDDVVQAMVIYCTAQTLAQTLLTIIVLKYRQLGIRSGPCDNMLDSLKRHAMTNILFLSDDQCLQFQGSLATGNLYKIEALRRKENAYGTVEAFRINMEMPPMKSLDHIKAVSHHMKFMAPALEIPVAQFQFRLPVIEFLNATDFPVKVISGLVGNHINNLQFKTDINPRGMYNRQVGSITGFNFSTGGYFVVYIDGILQPHTQPLAGNKRVFTFGLSCPIIGSPKIKVVDQTGDVEDLMGKKCYDSMIDIDSTPLYWTHSDKFYLVRASISLRDKGLDTGTWRFIIQEYDPAADVALMIPYSLKRGFKSMSNPIEGAPMQTSSHIGASSDYPLGPFEPGRGYGMVRIPKLRVDRYPSPHHSEDHHYVQFINEADHEITVKSGLAGRLDVFPFNLAGRVNNLKFEQRLQPQTSYERSITDTTWNFSSGGEIIIHQGTRTSEWKQIYFALSNPLVGSRKLKLGSKSSTQTVQAFWNTMDHFDPTPVYWRHEDTDYMAAGRISIASVQGCFTWQFVIQTYNPENNPREVVVYQLP